MLYYFIFSMEILLLSCIIFLLLFYSFYVNFKIARCYYVNLTRWFLWYSLSVISILTLFYFELPDITLYLDLGLRFDYWAYIGKGLVFICCWFYLLFLSLNYKTYTFVHIEFVVQLLSFILLNSLLVCANDFLSFFLLLDSQAIILFFLIAYNSSSMKATEASWKYFVLNGFASSLLLFGISLIFFVEKTISFSELSTLASCLPPETRSLVEFYALLAAFLIFFLGFFIKLGVFPFHFWMLDVYEGTSFILLPLVGVINKFAQFSIFFYIFFSIIPINDLLYFFLFFGLCSAIGSGFFIVLQNNIKRQMALFSVYSAGIVLLFLSSGYIFNYAFAFFYICIANFLLFVYFCKLSLLRTPNNQALLTSYSNFTSLLRNAKTSSFVVVILLISLLGLPPFVGFFPKFFLLYCLSNHLLVVYILFFLISTFLILFAFIFWIKTIFFAVETENYVQTVFLLPISLASWFYIWTSLSLSLLWIFSGSSILLGELFLKIIIL